MSRPKSDFDALREDLRRVYDGDPWHGSSITDVLKGVDADSAELKSIPPSSFQSNENYHPENHSSIRGVRDRWLG
jgi:hypothetical protein